MLKPGTREMIPAYTLKFITQYINTSIINLEELDDLSVLEGLLDIQNLLDLLQDNTQVHLVEADVKAKELILARLDESMVSLCLAVGKFYMENEFTEEVLSSDVLNFVVNTCIMNGFFFGFDKK